jgi:hypothetical protein
MSEPQRKIAEYHLLRQNRFSTLKRLELNQRTPERDGTSALTLTMELTSSGGNEGDMILTFEGVRQLRLVQAEWSVIQVPLLEIKDISERQWERTTYEIVDNEHGIFSFVCHDFSAVVHIR